MKFCRKLALAVALVSPLAIAPAHAQSAATAPSVKVEAYVRQNLYNGTSWIGQISGICQSPMTATAPAAGTSVSVSGSPCGPTNEGIAATYQSNPTTLYPGTITASGAASVTYPGGTSNLSATLYATIGADIATGISAKAEMVRVLDFSDLASDRHIFVGPGSVNAQTAATGPGNHVLNVDWLAYYAYHAVGIEGDIGAYLGMSYLARGFEMACDAANECDTNTPVVTVGRDALGSNGQLMVVMLHSLALMAQNNSGAEWELVALGDITYSDVSFSTDEIANAPEPASIVLVASGLIAVAGVARRRRR